MPSSLAAALTLPTLSNMAKNASLWACVCSGRPFAAVTGPQARQVLGLKPSPRAAASTFPRRSSARKYCAFSSGVYVLYRRFGGSTEGWTESFFEDWSPVREELLLVDDAIDVATPGFQGVLQPPLELAISGRIGLATVQQIPERRASRRCKFPTHFRPCQFPLTRRTWLALRGSSR